MSKKTVIIGSSPNPDRYAYLAAQKLTSFNHEIVPIGIKSGNIFGREILDLRSKPEINNVDTVTLYISPQNQDQWIQYIIDLKPKRIIFNPGTENLTFAQNAQEQNIETIEACTLVMLNIGNY